MSGYYYPPHTSPPDEDEFDFTPTHPILGTQAQTLYQTYTAQPPPGMLPQGQFYGKPADSISH